MPGVKADARAVSPYISGGFFSYEAVANHNENGKEQAEPYAIPAEGVGGFRMVECNSHSEGQREGIGEEKSVNDMVKKRASFGFFVKEYGNSYEEGDEGYSAGAAGSNCESGVAEESDCDIWETSGHAFHVGLSLGVGEKRIDHK